MLDVLRVVGVVGVSVAVEAVADLAVHVDADDPDTFVLQVEDRVVDGVVVAGCVTGGVTHQHDDRVGTLAEDGLAPGAVGYLPQAVDPVLGGATAASSQHGLQPVDTCLDLVDVIRQLLEHLESGIGVALLVAERGDGEA